MQNILLVVSNNKQFIIFTGITVTEVLNSSISIMISYIVHNADSHGEFSSLRPQTEYYFAVVSIPAS
jgi:hypothetical protein